MTESAKVTITQFKWAGNLGPFRIKTSCNECDLTTTILKGLMENELKDKNVKLEIKPWLDNLFYCLLRGAWHAPIVMINGKRFHQFSRKEPLFNKQKLIELVGGLSKER
jgi:hypothetical protein